MKKQKLRLTVFQMWDETDMPLPAMIARIPAGEPMELCDEVEMVDLNYLLVKDCPNSLILRVEGQSMCPEIADGDWIIVSRDVRPEIGDIVVASLNGEHTLKRLKRSDLKAKLYLVPSNENLQPKEVLPSDNFQVLAVVVRIIHNVRST